MFLMLGLVVFTISNLGIVKDWREKKLQEQNLSEDTMMELEPAESMLDPDTSMQQQYEDLMQYIGPNAPIFTQGDITPLGEFTNDAGTAFVVGTLHFQGSFPSDFEQKNFGIESAVDISLVFGWKQLPNFAGLELELNNTDEMIINLPKLRVLSIDIEVYESIPKTTMQEIETSIDTYIAMLFERQMIPNAMILMSQQRLANAYLQKNYNNIELIPFQQ